jgi:hypothetical protein
VKNHAPGIDVRLSADPNNAATYAVDGILVDRCDIITGDVVPEGQVLVAGADCTADVLDAPAVDEVLGESGGAWGPRPLISGDVGNTSIVGTDGGVFTSGIDTCDVVTGIDQATGQLLIEGPGCTAETLNAPAGANRIIGASGGAWGQRPLVSADAGNDAAVGTDGGVFADFSGPLNNAQICDIFDVATLQNSGNVLIQGGVDCRPERLRNPAACEVLRYSGGVAGWRTPEGLIVHDNPGLQFAQNALVTTAAAPGHTTIFSGSITNVSTPAVPGCSRLVIYQFHFNNAITRQGVAGTNLQHELGFSFYSDRNEAGALIAVTNVVSTSYIRNISSPANVGVMTHPGFLMYAHVLAPGQTANWFLDRFSDNRNSNAAIDNLVVSTLRRTIYSIPLQ